MHRILIERDAHAAVLLATGELDAYVAEDLTAAYAEIAGERRVVTDLTRVSFLDSTALGIVVRGSRDLTDEGADVRIVLPKGAARRIFEITALDRALPVAESRAAALHELAGAE